MTTVDIPRETLCKVAVELLLEDAAAMRQGREVRIETSLVVRNSTALPIRSLVRRGSNVAVKAFA